MGPTVWEESKISRKGVSSIWFSASEPSFLNDSFTSGKLRNKNKSADRDTILRDVMHHPPSGEKRDLLTKNYSQIPELPECKTGIEHTY
jgi:hypothetical protein